ncbi:SMI1/KNR4 family protein [Bacillus spongiae]|uniref:SMI1/KNR4 family protein n=1 Tax=Bacillus spongiae TaxID=2683610 RepID=A0ABU8HDS4_9BACI
MNILNNISSVYRIDARQFPSKKEEIKALQELSTIDVPTEYIELIQLGSDIEINVSNQMYIRIWGASGCIEMNEAYEVQRYLPNSLAIGDDEGGGALIYLHGKEGFGLYHNRFADLDIEEAVRIAPSLTELLVNNVGVNTLLDNC